MDTINIAFSFDKNYYRQAAIAISSLLDCSSDNTTYYIFCICSNDVGEDSKNEISNIVKVKSIKSRVTFITVDNSFDSSFEIRGITKAAYFRLLLHKLLPDLDKVIYADVDILFKDDIADIYKIDLGKNLLGAVKAPAINQKNTFDNLLSKHAYWEKELKDTRGNYFNSGFLLMNLKEIRKAGLDKIWTKMSKKSYFFVDQDILNITCKNKVYYLPARYNVVTYCDKSIYKELISEGILDKDEVQCIYNNPAMLHWAGEKPWDNKELPSSDKWWNYVKNSTPFYEYFNVRYLHPEIKNAIAKKNNNQLSILFFSHSGDLGGAERSLVDLIRGLSKEGIACSVIAPRKGDMISLLESMDVFVYCPSSSYTWWAFGDDATEDERNYCLAKTLNIFDEEIFKIVKNINPDIIYSQTIVAPWGAICAKRLNKPHILSVREYGELDHNLKFHFGFVNSMHAIYEDSDIVFSVSDDVKKTIFRDFEDNEDFYNKCITVGSSINISEKILKKSNESKKLRLTKNKETQILVLGSICKGKGQIDAVKAAYLLKKKGYNIKLSLVGKSNDYYLNKIRKEITNNEIDDIVEVREYTKNGLAEIINADILISCSRKEALGRVLFEAALLERPFIYANSGGSKEIFADGVHGLAYSPKDQSELADKVTQLIDNYSMTAQRILTAKEYVINNFNDDNFIIKQKNKIISYLRKNKKYNGISRNTESLVMGSVDYKKAFFYAEKLLKNMEYKYFESMQATSIVRSPKLWILKDKYTYLKNGMKFILFSPNKFMDKYFKF